MKKKIKSVLISSIIIINLCVLSAYFSGCCDPEIIGSVPNQLRPQETNNWCWAAVTEMLADHFDIAVNQCDLANTSFGRTDCCKFQTPGTSCPKTDSCDTPGWPMLDEAGLKFATSSNGLDWEDIQYEIYCDDTPMGYAYGTPGVVGHVVVIKGYVTAGGTDWVVLNDPWAPCSGSERLITYNDYIDPPGTSTHWTTWYNIEKKN